MGLTGKSDFQGGSRKTSIQGGFPKKGELGQFADFSGQIDKKEEGSVFEKGLIPPIHTMHDNTSY